MFECAAFKHRLSKNTASASTSAVRLMQRLLVMFVGDGGGNAAS
jgi:hypothetical protein